MSCPSPSKCIDCSKSQRLFLLHLLCQDWQPFLDLQIHVLAQGLHCFPVGMSSMTSHLGQGMATLFEGAPCAAGALRWA